jgi:AhpD family alkylhydroperoxidase
MKVAKENAMTTRMKLDPKRAGAALKALSGLRAAVDQSTLEPALQHLIDVRASQINGCAYCLDMHTKEARAAGETEQRLYLLDAWREAPFYTERERAALAWTDAATRIADHGVPDDVYEAARRVFSDDELTALALAVVKIDAWNRIVIPFGADVGSYQPADPRVAHR